MDIDIAKELVALRERVVRLEGKVEANTDTEERVATRLDRIDANLTTLNSVLNQAKGARWAFITLVALGGGGIYAFFQRLLGMPPPGGGAP